MGVGGAACVNCMLRVKSWIRSSSVMVRGMDGSAGI
jgi:hypothetical protein